MPGHVSSHLPLGATDASERRRLCRVRSGGGGRGTPRGGSNCRPNGPQSVPASGPVRSGPRAAVVRPGGQRRPAVLSSQDARGPLAAPEHVGHGRRGFRQIPTAGSEQASICGITYQCSAQAGVQSCNKTPIDTNERKAQDGWGRPLGSAQPAWEMLRLRRWETSLTGPAQPPRSFPQPPQRQLGFMERESPV